VERGEAVRLWGLVRRVGIVELGEGIVLVHEAKLLPHHFAGPAIRVPLTSTGQLNGSQVCKRTWINNRTEGPRKSS